MLPHGTLLQHRYEVLRPLGSGAAASTLLAVDRLRGDTLALKLLRSDEPTLTQALRREFTLLSGRYHPYLLHVRDLGSCLVDHQERLFYTADYVPGSPLQSWAQDQPAPNRLRPLADTLAALHFLHRLGIRHGDVKPGNIIVDAQGRATLIDLGCARPLRTASDTVSGTASYMAPELLRGEATDETADLFAFGVCLREVMGPDLPPKLAALVDKLLQQDPARRPREASEVREALGFHEQQVGPPHGRHPHLLDRDEPMRQFRGALDALVRGSAGPRAIAMVGRDGAGRSRLLYEMKWEAQAACDVIEGWSQAPDAVTGMIGRALGQDAACPGVSALLEARRALRTRPRPCVLVLDDTHALDPHQRELWEAWLRMLERTDPYLVLSTGRDGPAVESHALRTLTLSPLSHAAVAEWTQGVIGSRATAEVMRLTGGFPADVESLVARLASGSLAETQLATSGPEVLAPSHRGYAELPSGARRTLALIAMAPLDAARLRALGAFEPAILAGLQSDGWIARHASTWRLVRAADAPGILASLDTEQLAALHRRCASLAERASDRALHFAKAADLDGFLRVLRSAEHDVESHPQQWRRVVEAMPVDAKLPADVAVGLARVQRRCGETGRALSLLARILRSRPSRPIRLACHEEAAACRLAAGRLRQARLSVRKALEQADCDTQRARCWEIGCRIGVQLGNYEQVVLDAQRALRVTTVAATRARLEESLGVALAYLGRGSEAAEHLARAEQERPEAPPRDRVRVHSYQAIAAYREGDLPGAVAGYRKAVDVAEKNGLADHLASASMNLGTALQQDGAWGEALDAYERGQQVARAVGKQNTLRTLRLNLANLYAAIGLFDRASALLDALRQDAQTADLGYVQASVLALRAEVVMHQGDLDEADRLFGQARVQFETQGAKRELCEMDLQRALVALAKDDRSSVEALLDGVDVKPSTPDLQARLHLVRSSLRKVQGRIVEAQRDAEAARRAASASGQRALEAEAEGCLSALYAAQGADQLARDHRQAARRSWETIAVGLPVSARPAFWRHPLRAPVQDAEPDRPPERQVARPHDLVRILEINRQLNSSLTTDQVLACALDAAIELTEAERGFVLVRGQGKHRRRLDVAVARNLDRERIGRSHLKFSRSIAEDVVRTGEPVATTDALADDRFRSNASVHAMRLRSVVCVPVTAPQGVLGAIYLDHRFHKEHFGKATISLLQAFADQVAIALRNARLVSDLEARTQALQAEQARVQALLRGQAEEIDRLSAEVRTRQEVLELRYDYSSIVGDSAPMRALFRTLDRVTDASIDVLVQGESGTGKELVARAIHFNGPRRSQRFVSVNCAALPDNLLESELFGVVRGAYTGAERDREGLVATARGGTLFLDEVGEMSLAMQAKLLRVLQERKVRPLGSSREVDVDVRLVCATNRRLRDEVDGGRFREDLFYRIGVVELELPALRDRKEDIPALGNHLLARAAKAMGREPPALRPDALRALMGHPLPGNVRQLDNILRRALVMAESSEIRSADLDLGPAPGRSRARSRATDREAYEREEGKRILAALRETRWNVSEVARSLGIPRNTLYRKLRKYRIDRPD